jgi:hypothetical protein
VVRVEPNEKFVPTDTESEDNTSVEESMDVEYDCLSAEVSGKEDVGRGVARVMFGKSVFRGTIQKVIFDAFIHYHHSPCLNFQCLPFSVLLS